MPGEIANDHVTQGVGEKAPSVMSRTLCWKLIRIIVVFLPPLGVVAAMFLLWDGSFGPLYLALFGFMYLLKIGRAHV